MTYIYHHLGLGDYIICNGLIRTIADPKEDYYIFIEKQNLTSVQWMYWDMPNIHFHIVDGWDEMHQLTDYLEANNQKVIRINFQEHKGYEFDEYFYVINKVDFSKRWDSFHCQRDMQLEINLFKKYNVTEGKYIFLHDDSSRGFNIDESHIKHKHLPIIRPIPGLTDNIFDYCYLMEKSIESHFIDSSFRLVFDSLQLRSENIYYHINLLNGVIKDSTKSQSRLPFIMI